LKRQEPQVFTIAVQQIECVKARIASMEQKTSELRHAAVIKANDLPIQNRSFGTTLRGQGDVQSWEGPELVPIAGY
jgi:hypothetical protein